MKTTIYIKLIDEVIDVWRPVSAIQISENIFQVSTDQEYDTEIEEWEFVPGDHVEVETQILSNGPKIVAVRQSKKT